MSLKRVDICNVSIDSMGLGDAVNEITKLMNAAVSHIVVTPNLDHIVKLQKDREFKNIYSDAALVLPDGMPVIWASKFLGTPLKEKISGSDLFPKVCEMAAKTGYRLFFLGGRGDAALKSAEVFKKKYPGIQVAGVYSPPVGFEMNESENNKIVRMIKDAKPHILFVGLGSPKQEKWIYKYKDEYRVPVSIGVGAAFDFTAGVIKRAPKWMQKAGLEWLWRLMIEPRRLWKRYLIDDMVFFWLVLRQKLNPRRSQPRAR